MKTDPHSLLQTIPLNQRIRVASLNFLNDPDRYDQRIEVLLSELKTLDPDVLCLQEVLTLKAEGLIEALREVGLIYYTHSTVLSPTRTGDQSGNYTFSKFPFESAQELLVDMPNEIGLVSTRYKYNTQEVHVINGHFAFGPTREYDRCLQAARADTYAVEAKKQNPEAIILLTGDLNATSDTDTILYLRGKRALDRRSTLWVDSYEYLGTPDIETTSDSDTYWGIQTAVHANNPIFPNIAEARRIDYIFSYGWVYGKAGTPVTYDRWGDTCHPKYGFEVSDHYGVTAEIFCP